jgi:hypothetical protein
MSAKYSTNFKDEKHIQKFSQNILKFVGHVGDICVNGKV